MVATPPDIIVLGTDWRNRSLLRAQLIEEGYDVVAVDQWPIPALYRRHGLEPRLLLIDLQGLPATRETLNEVRDSVRPDHVLVLTALGSLPAPEVRAFGFNVVERPASIGEVVAATAALLSDHV